MNKLDAAFDIDPLFHKMSKTFDEGGARGMLLANLRVATEGCGIVFDSKQHSDPPAVVTPSHFPAAEVPPAVPSTLVAPPPPPLQQLTTIDMTSLNGKLQKLLNGSPLDR